MRREGDSDSDRNDVEEEEMDSDSDQNSNLVDALSFDPELKKKVSDEVNLEIRRELRLQEINAHSKQIQYSSRASSAGGDIGTTYITEHPIKARKIAESKRKDRGGGS